MECRSTDIAALVLAGISFSLLIDSIASSERFCNVSSERALLESTHSISDRRRSRTNLFILHFSFDFVHSTIRCLVVLFFLCRCRSQCAVASPLHHPCRTQLFTRCTTRAL